MKLQVNNSGAWKTVATFDAAAATDLQHHTDRLGELAMDVECGVKWQLLDDQDSVFLMWTYPKGWHQPPWVAAREKATAEDAGVPL